MPFEGYKIWSIWAKGITFIFFIWCLTPYLSIKFIHKRVDKIHQLLNVKKESKKLEAKLPKKERSKKSSK